MTSYVALTRSELITLDSDLRPTLQISGIVALNSFGEWRFMCVNTSVDEATVATKTCNLLGFEEYSWFYTYNVTSQPLQLTIDSFQVERVTNFKNDSQNTCHGLYVRCSTMHVEVDHIFLDDVGSKTPLWNAFIYNNGVFTCMGTLITQRHVITSGHCFGDMEITLKSPNYIAVLLGIGREFQVDGPYQQISEVTGMKVIKDSDIILLYLSQDVTITRFTKNINLLPRRNRKFKEDCFAPGFWKNTTRYIPLKPANNCSRNFRCFESMKLEDCQTDTIFWSGTITCNSGSGWYPAAVIYRKNSSCKFPINEQFTNIGYYVTDILDSLDVSPPKLIQSVCNGFRCKLGQCLNWDYVCNNIPDCRTGEDEFLENCEKKETECLFSNTCGCPVSEMTCNSGKCVAKDSFCDKVLDCDDYEDEPDVCSCREYLLLAHPDKICDGIPNCVDRSDEDPVKCPCQPNGIKCQNASICVSNYMICDGHSDCPGGEDEVNCLALRTEGTERNNSGEVIRRTSGIWHSGCFKQYYSSSELQEICTWLGFETNNPSQLTHLNETDLLTERLTLDEFRVLWIHKHGTDKLKLRIRNGNSDYVSFAPDNNCFKLFITC